MESISDRIRFALEQKGLKQLDLAEVVGVSTAAVSKWIKGNTKNLKSENLIAISKALDVPLVWLISGEVEAKDLPFSKIELTDLYKLPPQYLEDIEDYILMKIKKHQETLTDNNKKTA